MVLWRPTKPSRTNTPKRCPFHYKGLECKSRKSRDTWSNRQIWPWSTQWSRAKANRVLPRERTGHSKYPLLTTQEKTLYMDIIRWSIPKSDDNVFCSQRWRSSIQSAKTGLGGGKNTQKNCTKKIFLTQIWWCDHSPRARHPGMWSQVGLKKHYYEQI